MPCDRRGLADAPAYALFLWSDIHGGWFALLRCERRQRKFLGIFAALFDLLRELLDDHRNVVLCGVPSVEAADVAAFARAMAPPMSARFVDPAPDGVIEPERVGH